MLITPSGKDYAGMSTVDIVWMDLDGNCQGWSKPSSEWRFHADHLSALRASRCCFARPPG